MLRFSGKLLIGIVLLTVGVVGGVKGFPTDDHGSDVGRKMLMKRGYSSGNDFGPPMQVSSGVIYLDSAPRATGPDAASGAVWLEPDSGFHNYQEVHAVLEAHPSGSAEGAALGGSIFSSPAHEGGLGGHLSNHASGGPSLDGHVSGTLHTQISGNVDFHNVADAKPHRRSYGRR